MDTPVPSSRRLDLDWLRITAFGLLILYHVGLLYVPWPYHAKSRHSLPALVPVLEAVNPWRLLLLFLISGVATRFMARKLSLGRLLSSRSMRLLLPLVFGVLVVVPPQSFVQAMEQYGYTGSYFHFYGADYLGRARRLCNPAGCLALPTWNHLWFVLYLYIYTVLLIGLLALWGQVGSLLRPTIAIVTSAPALYVLPPLFLVAARVLLYLFYPPNDALLGDWYDHATYAGAFLFGYAIAEHEAVWTAAERWRWPALVFAALLLPSVWLGGGVLLVSPLGHLAFAPLLAVPLYQWAALVAVCGFGGCWLPRTDGPARRYLTGAVFPCYIVHQTALILCAHALRPLALPLVLEAATVVAVTAAACLATFEAVRRVAVLRPLFGLRPLVRGQLLHAR